ncbi:negative regulator GrlR [Xenorhabdus sp. XENO-1]|uniref:GrlR family regulatory protein n=1 Tax=Xenorhabdus bovienii TaxID=40576 RepID=UPI0020CA6363|nr:GrlR family regulatory protein [Xenorhabdus bovienii]MCP9270371.1 negative regulator GrlR [Xenorhabdus bovienii subsp. africana]
MKDGIYFVSFRSNVQDFGNGAVVVRNNVINGGDYVCTYRGRLTHNSITLTVEQHNKEGISVFGNISKFNLLLSVQETSIGYSLNGIVEGMPELKIETQAKFIGDLIS